ncbi:MAG: hypothetical protein AAFW98_16310 [Pseudomonadota bacterium]
MLRLMDATPMHGGSGGGPSRGPQSFAVGYRPHTGDMMVYGGGVLTLIGVLATVVQGSPIFLLASIAGSVSAFYFAPTLDLRSPQLGADAGGLFIARVGVIPWDAVREIRVEKRALRTMHLATLYLRTDGPVYEVVVHADPVTPLQRVSARNARVSGDTVRVSLHTLALSAEAIEIRLRALHDASRG